MVGCFLQPIRVGYSNPDKTVNYLVLVCNQSGLTVSSSIKFVPLVEVASNDYGYQ